MPLEPPPLQPWPADAPLVRFGDDVWCTRDAFEGTLILGATGSGKTSGSGSAIARAFLSRGFGGIVLCAKTEEPGLWRTYARECGREDDLLFFGSDPQWSFNFMRHESARSGAGAGLTENLVNLFTEVAALGAGESRTGGGDPFWERAMRSLVRNSVDLLRMAGEEVSLHAMTELIQSCPREPEVARSDVWRQSSRCWSLCERARERAIGTSWDIDCRDTLAYWLVHVPSLGDRTRGSIVAMFTTLAEGLMRDRMRELFCSESTLGPEHALAGRVIVVDLPVKEWAEVGRMAAVIWKYCTQKAVERRADNAGGHARPVFIWADECQHFVSRYDAQFQATARSSRAASVYLTQNLPSLSTSMGGGSAGRAVAEALLGNLSTKIFHANSDLETNRLACELAGRRTLGLRNRGAGSNLSLGSGAAMGLSAQRGMSETVDLEIQPAELSRLRKGGVENTYVTEALVFQNGRCWAPAARTWQKVRFRQRSPGPREAAVASAPGIRP
jgi:TraM recognition site of TraD and TraG